MNLARSPIYQQLHELLKNTIKEGGMKPGDKFLTEREIAQRYNVSRVTANKVLSSWVSEGLLDFRKGVGSFVRSYQPQDNLLALVSFTENVRSAGMKPSSKVLHFGLIDSSELEPAIRERLSIAQWENVYEVKRIRYINNIPMIIECRYIVAKFCYMSSRNRILNIPCSIFSPNVWGLTIVRSEETIEAVVLSEEEVTLLGNPEKMAGFLVTTMGYLSGDRPLWWEKAVHRPDAFVYRCRVRPSVNGGNVSINQVLTHVHSINEPGELP